MIKNIPDNPMKEPIEDLHEKIKDLIENKLIEN